MTMPCAHSSWGFFGCLVVLILAWSSGSIMKGVGLNRLFGAILTNPDFDYTLLPTISFVISLLITFATGTSFGTMSIMFPLIMAPSYAASNGDPIIFYAVAASILAGAVAGDHASPISDTTVLASSLLSALSSTMSKLKLHMLSW